MPTGQGEPIDRLRKPFHNERCGRAVEPPQQTQSAAGVNAGRALRGVHAVWRADDLREVIAVSLFDAGDFLPGTADAPPDQCVFADRIDVGSVAADAGDCVSARRGIGNPGRATIPEYPAVLCADVDL